MTHRIYLGPHAVLPGDEVVLHVGVIIPQAQWVHSHCPELSHPLIDVLAHGVEQLVGLIAQPKYL